MEEADNYEPVHTFTRKVVPNQIAAYLIMIALLITFLAAVQPNIEDQPLRIVLTILFILCFLTALASGWVTSRRDPVDPVLSDYRGGRRSQITVALETCLYCDVCHSYVLTTSRHCRMCNR